MLGTCILPSSLQADADVSLCITCIPHVEKWAACSASSPGQRSTGPNPQLSGSPRTSRCAAGWAKGECSPILRSPSHWRYWEEASSLWPSVNRPSGEMRKTTTRRTGSKSSNWEQNKGSRLHHVRHCLPCVSANYQNKPSSF